MGARVVSDSDRDAGVHQEEPHHRALMEQTGKSPFYTGRVPTAQGKQG